uniref:NADH:ubiquinone reductase (H(+)-translocating) n=1 Tax=Paraconotrochus antarcticus TaxID=2666516 RepID=A0A7T1W6L6_9CNID|nr:NADH dehydrogenase subunit 2 [Paraconotrochus antarcticus]QPO84676.1 NADH dehydrogenase subunit 2 [Paraconotrochus antarcticus]
MLQNTANAPVLNLMVALGGLCLISSKNWLFVYLSIELPTLSFFILIAWREGSGQSAEAGLKYFVLGAFSSGLFLVGCALLCAATGRAFLSHGDLTQNFFCVPLGNLLITIALLFKLSAAPFHIWTPDVYEGAPGSTTALLAIVPKIGVFSLLVSIGPAANILLMGVLASLIVGALGALNQTRIKRLLAYSGVGHVGFILWGMETGSFGGLQASLLYLGLYVLMSICAFTIVLALNMAKSMLVEFTGLSRRFPLLGGSLALVFLSIAGIPPLAGFIGKWLVLLTGVTSGSYLIFFFAIACAVLSGVYYVRIVKIIYFQVGHPLLISLKMFRRESQLNLKKAALMGFSLYLIGLVVLVPNLWLLIITEALEGLF